MLRNNLDATAGPVGDGSGRPPSSAPRLTFAVYGNSYLRADLAGGRELFAVPAPGGDGAACAALVYEPHGGAVGYAPPPGGGALVYEGPAGGVVSDVVRAFPTWDAAAAYCWGRAAAAAVV